MVITAEGEVIAYQFYPAVMHSAARFTYTEVAAILGNTKGTEANKRSALVPHLLHLQAAFKSLLAARQRRGAIDFETTETYIVCNAAGKIEKILPRTRNDAHKLIEECMLAANVCAADLLIRHKHPGVFRIHATPSKEKLTQVRNYLKQLGLNLTGGDKPSATDYAQLMSKIKGRLDAPVLQTMLLRSMQQAVYSPDNIGHFGLSYDAYAHFTSPIRRYPDLLTHRAIKAILAGQKYEPKGIDLGSLNSTISNAARRQQMADKAEGKVKDKKDPTIWDALGVHCSANERRADEASRDVEAWLKCYYIRNHLGEEFTGTISGVTQFGLFVQLDDLYIEGLVHVTDLGADYFQYDEARHELRGERTGKRYQLTDRLTVQVSRVDLDARKIDLSLVQKNAAGRGFASVKKVAATDSKNTAKGTPKSGAKVRIVGDVDFDDIAPSKAKAGRVNPAKSADKVTHKTANKSSSKATPKKAVNGAPKAAKKAKVRAKTSVKAAVKKRG